MGSRSITNMVFVLLLAIALGGFAYAAVDMAQMAMTPSL